MTSNCKRRTFLKVLGGSAGAFLADSVTPRFTFANTVGNGRNLILVNLAGGHDDKFIFPLVNAASATLNARRPTIAISPSVALTLNGDFGLHPSWGTPFYNIHQLDRSLKLISTAGIPNNSGSHNDDANLMSVGMLNAPANQRDGFLARAINAYNLSMFQVLGINSGARLDFYGAKASEPLVMGNLSSFRRGTRSGTGADGTLAAKIAEQMLELPLSVDPKEAQIRSTLKTANQAIARVSTFNSVQLNASYPSSGLGGTFRDVAKVLRGKQSSNDTSSTIIYTTYGGFDTHGDEGVALPGRISDMGASIAALVSDLKTFNLWNSTTIYFFSEFGRTNYENGGKGTDHGAASTHFVLGGNINGGANLVAGPVPSISDLNRDNTPVQVDYRNIYHEIFQWMGYDPARIFPESYTRVNLQLFKA